MKNGVLFCFPSYTLMQFFFFFLLWKLLQTLFNFENGAVWLWLLLVVGAKVYSDHESQASV